MNGYPGKISNIAKYSRWDQDKRDEIQHKKIRRYRQKSYQQNNRTDYAERRIIIFYKDI